jgi:hypothetical protein
MTPEQAQEIIRLLADIAENASCLSILFLFYFLGKIFGILK